MDRIQKVNQEIQEILPYLGRLHSLPQQNKILVDFSRLVEEFKDELKRRHRAFDTRRFFVVTIGALKSGKSTLINALVG